MFWAGKRIDVGQPLPTGDILIYLCEYGFMTDKQFFCPYRDVNTYRKVDGLQIPPVIHCPMSQKEPLQDHVCYQIQKHTIIP